MADARYRLRADDPDYGTICSVCAGHKTVQARRCAACLTDWNRDNAASFARFGADNANWKGGYVRPSKAKARPVVSAQDQSHPWRRLRKAA